MNKNHGLVDRLDSLETLVSSFLATNKPAPKAEASLASSASQPAPGELTPETPRLQTSENGEVNYIDPGHWQSILEDIREVRDHLSPSQDLLDEQATHDMRQMREKDAGFVFGSRNDVDIDDILSALPPQPICDMLLSWYFGIQYMSLCEYSPHFKP